MANQSLKRLLKNIDFSIGISRKQVGNQKFVYNIFSRCQSNSSNTDGHNKPEEKSITHGPGRSKYDLDNDDFNDNKWKLELAWLSKAVEPAVQLCRWALSTGNGNGDKLPPTNKSLAEIFASIQRSKLGLQDWSLTDLTIGLYLIYLQQASTSPIEDVKGEQIHSDLIVQDLIYHTELAKGAYKDCTTALARNCMLRESNVVKFIKNSSVLRPGYYIGIDKRRKLVILGIRGTHTVYDLITDIVSSSHEEITLEGYSTHFGTAEAARWFLFHEMGTIRNCLEKHKGFRLRLVGHSLGGATASLLAIMLRNMSVRELGFSPDIVSAVGYATPPCVSRELAESCSEYVTTVVMQDDIIPRLSTASLTRLRNEILQTNWVSVLQKEDWRGVVDLFTNAKQVVSSVQDVARRLADYAQLRGQTKHSGSTVPRVPNTSNSKGNTSSIVKQEGDVELFVPGTLYILKRNANARSKGNSTECFTLWKRHSGEHFQRILLSNNIISDHKCDSHYYALRDVLKGLPGSSDEAVFR
ncbi:uncharacterized protein LOC132053053 [Lycium ferocissimum]|uniref:uncharacterized protein LOC132053053 n=1 Tax=Lycium ferocissimum TaxID=112874 RepID=UPI002814D589|nr:uncharacterized protein LOC132053053 [Lycium ferocissimum]